MQPLLSAAITVISPSWTLGIELLFYVAALWLVRFPLRVLAVLLAASAFLFVALPDIHLATTPGPTVPAAVLWAWLLGWIIYKKRDSVFVGSTSLALPAILVHANSQGPGRFAVVPCIIAAFALLYSHQIKLSQRWSNIANYLGELSYPLYLSHYPIFCVIFWLYPTAPIAVCYVVSLLGTAALYHVIDAPIRRRFATPLNRELYADKAPRDFKTHEKLDTTEVVA